MVTAPAKPDPETQREVFAPWVDDPVTFAEETLAVHPREFQPEILRAIATRKKFVVCACRNAGKTCALAMAALWFLVTRRSLVFIVGPTHNQTANLFREIKALWITSRLPQLFPDFELLDSEIRNNRDPLHRLKCVSAESGAEHIEGSHGPNVLVIVDEAKAVPDAIRASLDGMLGGDGEKKLVAGSTAGGPEGWFYEAFGTSRNQYDAHLTIRADEIPRLVPQFEKVKKERGEHDPFFRQQWCSEFTAASGLTFFNLTHVEKAIGLELDVAEGVKVSAGVDIARGGRDQTAVTVRQGGRILGLFTWDKKDTMDTVGRVILLIKEFHIEHVGVDTIGVGGGVADRLREELDYRGMSPYVAVLDCNAGASPPEDGEHFGNWKTYAAHRLRTAFERGRISLPVNHPLTSRLVAELLGYTQVVQSNGKVRIKDTETKSPDLADSLLLSFFAEELTRVSAKMFSVAGL